MSLIEDQDGAPYPEVFAVFASGHDPQLWVPYPSGWATGSEAAARRVVTPNRQHGWRVVRCQLVPVEDEEPQPGDGPDYHADHVAWEGRQDDTQRVMAVADAEQAEIRAEIERLRALTSPRKAEAMASLVRSYSRLTEIERDDARTRAEAAEAEVERLRAEVPKVRRWYAAAKAAEAERDALRAQVEAAVNAWGVNEPMGGELSDEDPWAQGWLDARDRIVSDFRECISSSEPVSAGEGSSLPIHRIEAGYPNCATCDGGGCPDCTDPA